MTFSFSTQKHSSIREQISPDCVGCFSFHLDIPITWTCFWSPVVPGGQEIPLEAYLSISISTIPLINRVQNWNKSNNSVSLCDVTQNNKAPPKRSPPCKRSVCHLLSWSKYRGQQFLRVAANKALNRLKSSLKVKPETKFHRCSTNQDPL